MSTIAIGASAPASVEHVIPPAASRNWVTAFGAWVPNTWAPEIAARLIDEGFTARPQGNTLQFIQDRRGMPTVDQLRERILVHRAALSLEKPEPKEDTA